MQTLFYAELTDTFGGEPNYLWVSRFKVHASTPLGAIRKLAKETGLTFRKQWDNGDCIRYDSTSGSTCLFLMPYDLKVLP